MRSLVCMASASAFAPPCLMSGSYDRTIKLWELCEAECKSVGSLGTRGSVRMLAEKQPQFPGKPWCPGP